jgi:Lrp/AsnC family leucine-responsive transcriptional regulator
MKMPGTAEFDENGRPCPAPSHWRRAGRAQADSAKTFGKRFLRLPKIVRAIAFVKHIPKWVLGGQASSLSHCQGEVIEAYLPTGEYDYLIKVAVSGTEGYERFLRQKLYEIPGIRHSRSTFALRCLKRVHSVSP